MIEVFIDQPYFYWIIPEGAGVARVGVLSKNPYHDLIDFIQKKKFNKNV